MADYKMSPLERQELYFQRFYNGLPHSDKIEGSQHGFKYLEELQKIINGDPKNLNFDFSLDLLWLARRRLSTGLLASKDYEDISGSSWLAPFYPFCHHVALFTYINKVHKGNIEEFYSSNGQENFQALWILSFDELHAMATQPDKMEDKLRFFLDVQISINKYLFLPEVSDKKDQRKGYETMYSQFYNMVKGNVREHQPLKKMKKEKDDRWDVLMWDGKEHTALKNESVDELLSKTGHTYRIEEMFKQVPLGEESLLETEMNQLRLIRDIKPVQVAQKGMTRDSYFKQIQRIAQIGTLFSHSIIRLGTQKHKERVLDDRYWLDDKTPKGCPETGVLNIMEIKAFITEEAKEVYPWLNDFNKYPSMRDCLKLFKIFRDENIVDWGDKFPLKGGK